MKRDRILIIGNGFDLEHGMKTRFTDFIKTLLPVDVNLYSRLIEYDDNFGVIDSSIRDMTDEILEKWGNIENMIDQRILEYYSREIINAYDSILFDEIEYFSHDDYGLHRDMIVTSHLRDVVLSQTEEKENLNNIKEYVKLLECFQEDFKDYLYALPRPTALFNLNYDKYISFNYTKVLEDTYKIPLECVHHIHGDIDSHIIIGCNSKVKNKLDKETFQDDNYDKYDGTQSPKEYMIEKQQYDRNSEMGWRLEVIEETQELVKNEYDKHAVLVDKSKHDIRISIEEQFFSDFEHIEQIDVFGHSLSDMDNDFFEKLNLNANQYDVAVNVYCLTNDIACIRDTITMYGWSRFKIVDSKNFS